ncbi:MAG TPA: L,D-transpeptidase [Blastocatellia bacterium]|nr:L,D-transpeptidase [Blastocatellia bacterium]
MKRPNRTTFLLTQGLVIPFLASAIACRAKEADSPGTAARAGELPAVESEAFRNRPTQLASTAAPNSATPLRLEAFKVQGRKSIADLESRLGAEAFAAVLKINRIDRRHIRVGDSLIVPAARFSNQSASPETDLIGLAPFPIELEAARRISKLILVSRRVQAFGAYEAGRLVRWGPTSTGKKSTPTPAGLYHANWKAKKTRSTVNASWILPWVFNLDNFAGVSFHQYELPGYPASHGCVRLLEEDAKWIYDWAEQWTLSRTDRSILACGTPVVIFGDYKYGEKPVWQRLVDDPSAAAVSMSETESVLNQHIAAIEIKARARRELNARFDASHQDAARPEADAHRL